MALCDKLVSYDFTFDCESNLTSGVAEIALINASDIKTVTKTGSKATIALLTGKKASKIEVFKNGAGFTSAGKINDNAPSRLSFTAFFTAYNKSTDLELAALKALRSGRFVMVIKGKDNTTYDVVGLDAFLEFSNQERDSNAAGGVRKVTLVTPENSLGDNEYTMDAAAYTALFTPAT